MLDKYFKIWWFQVLYMIVNVGFLSILYVYFVKNELSFWIIILAEAFGYLFAVVFIALKNNFKTRRDMVIGFFLILISMLILLLPVQAYYLLFPYIILKLLGSVIFYVPYNVLFFENTQQDKKVGRMTLYWAIGIVAGVLAPITGGYIFKSWGLGLFISCASIFLFLAFLSIKYVKKEVYRYKLKQVLTYIKGVRTITILDGGLRNTSGLLITLFLLNFVRDEFDFGKILSVIAFISVFFSFKLSKISDKYKKRVEFIWPLSILSAILLFCFYFVDSLFTTTVFVVLFRFVTILFNPISSNILFDKNENVPLTWISREMYLNIGRFIILSSISLVVYLGFLRESFIIVALAYLAFPFIVRFKKIYAKIS